MNWLVKNIPHVHGVSSVFVLAAVKFRPNEAKELLNLAESIRAFCLRSRIVEAEEKLLKMVNRVIV